MKDTLRLLGSLKVTVVGLLLLLVLTLWGTLYQADHGLYLAQERFYQSWMLLAAGLVPFPGAKTVMLVLFVNLVSALVSLGLRRKLNVGMVTTHLGLIMMLSAGAATFYFGQEAQLTLAEGEGANVAVSYGSWELSLVEPGPGPGTRIHALSTAALKPGRTLPLPLSGLSMRVDTYYRNCEPVPPARSQDDADSASGLRRLPRHKEPGRNVPGLRLTLQRDGEAIGTYQLWGNDPQPTVLRNQGQVYQFGLRRRRMPLPALIQLVDFRRELHPGSGIASSYSSRVRVRSDEGSDREVLISMNKPLRLKGYTLYQSSYSTAPGGQETSTLAVVLNYGRLLPYVATGLTVLGMTLHFTGMLVLRLRRRRLEEAGS